VFWVHAANAARFEQAYRDIANKAEIPGRENPKADILKLVYNWLCDERNGRWLMVLDNADDDESFFDHTKPLESFLAQTPTGRILITSRNRTAALNLVGPCGHIIQVEPINEKEALTLLNTRVPFSESNKADAKTLVQALEYIPLAITHAAAYIKSSSRMTMPDYLRLFRAGLPSDQINNQIYQSIQSIQIKYGILTDQSIQTQVSVHLIYLISLERKMTTLELSDYPYFPVLRVGHFHNKQ
jgi:hypothetical protein